MVCHEALELKPQQLSADLDRPVRRCAVQLMYVLRQVDTDDAYVIHGIISLPLLRSASHTWSIATPIGRERHPPHLWRAKALEKVRSTSNRHRRPAVGAHLQLPSSASACAGIRRRVPGTSRSGSCQPLHAARDKDPHDVGQRMRLRHARCLASELRLKNCGLLRTSARRGHRQPRGIEPSQLRHHLRHSLAATARAPQARCAACSSCQPAFRSRRRQRGPDHAPGLPRTVPHGELRSQQPCLATAWPALQVP